jgi:hypothetical protein
MNLGRTFSRRVVLALCAVLGFSVLFGGVAQAAKKAPNIKGEWQGELQAEGQGSIPFALSIQKQNAKSGKFKGQASLPGINPVKLSGKINKAGEIKGSFPAELNGVPVVVSFQVTVNHEGTSGDGDFSAKTQDGTTVASGFIGMEKTHAG